MNSQAAAPLLLHYHVFKNAGTSFNWALRNAFGSRFHEFDAPVPGVRLSQADIARFLASGPDTAAISSHQITLPPPELAGRTIYSTVLLRDPLVRARSVYFFQRRQEASSIGAAKAKELDFRGYLEWSLANRPTAVCNLQVSFCSRTPETPRPFVPREDDLQIAIENLNRVDLVGTVERYGEWLALVERVLQEPFPGISLPFSHHNATTDAAVQSTREVTNLLRAELGESLLDRLQERNELDMRLYRIADASLSRRLAETRAATV